MKNVIWGFDFNIQNYGMQEVYLYLLVVTLIALITGRYAEKQKTENQYLFLIRYKTETKWWMWQCLRMAFLAAVLVVLLFTGYILECLFEKNKFDSTLLYPFVMWYLAVLSFGMLQKLVSETNIGSKWIYLMATVIELISLYAETLGLKTQLAKWLPGNYLMYLRYGNGYESTELKCILAMEILFSSAVCLKMYFGRKR